MSFSEVKAIGCSVASGVGLGAATLGHAAPTIGHSAAAAGLTLDTSSLAFNHAAPSLGQAPAPTPTPVACHSAPVLGASAVAADGGKPPAPSLVPSPPPLPPLSSPSSLSSPGSAILTGIQVSSPLSSPTVSYVSVSRPNMVTMRGIGGFTSPTTLSPPPPIVTSNSIASTLGNPQMPSVTYFNSPSPMGFNFRMAGSHLSGLSIVYKRKPEEEPEEVRKPVTKQHISEERMAAHLNSLHLSESYFNHRLGKRAMKGWSEKEIVADMDEDQGLGEEEQGVPSPEGTKGSPRLYIADEVSQIIPGESQLPQQLLKKLAQPRMEVVLWQPPGNVIRNIITTTVNQQQQGAKSTSDPGVVAAAAAPAPSSDPTASSSAAPPQESSNSSSPDSGVSVTSPPPSLGFPSQDSAGASASSFASSTSSSDMDDLLSLPSTSSGSRGGGYMPPPLRRPASPLPDPMVDDDFSERMEFNNNNDNAPNYMWLEENNNSALIDLNAIEPHRAPHLDDLPDLPDSDDMDL